MIFPRFCYGCNVEQTWLCENCEKSIVKINRNSCFLCHKLTSGGICSNCRRKIPITGCYSIGYYRDPILKKLIHEFKYIYVTDLKKILGNLLEKPLNEIPKNSKNTIFVPVPLHKSRQRERGFNQSEILSLVLSQKTEIPTVNLLKRIKQTKPQAGLRPYERPKNIKDAFSINKNLIDLSKNIILIDDVITTGQTVGECARVLRQSGYKKIYALTIARG